MGKARTRRIDKLTRDEQIVRKLTSKRPIAWAVAVFAVVSALVAFSNDLLELIGRDDLSRQERVAAIRGLADDLEKVKVLLPPDKVIADCLNSRHGERFTNAFEACDSQSKRNQTHALNLLDRNLATLKVFLPANDLNTVTKRLEAIRFGAYEMHNNHLAKERWHSEGCPSAIDFLDASNTDKLPRDQQGKVKCALSVESYDTFLNRGATTDDPFSAVASQSIPTNGLKLFVVPGTQESIEDYFLRSNKRVYNSMLGEMGELLPELKEIAER